MQPITCLRFAAAPRVEVPTTTVNHRKWPPQDNLRRVPVNRRQCANNNTGFTQVSVLHHHCRFLFQKQKQSIKNKCRRTPGFAHIHVHKLRRVHVTACACNFLQSTGVQARRCSGRQASLPAVRGGPGAEVEAFCCGDLRNVKCNRKTETRGDTGTAGGGTGAKRSGGCSREEVRPLLIIFPYCKRDPFDGE